MRLNLSILAVMLTVATASFAKPPDLPRDLDIEFAMLRPTEEPILPAVSRDCDHTIRRHEAKVAEHVVPLRRRMPTEPQPKSIWQELLRYLEMLRTTEPIGPAPAEDSPF